jgi:stalled ribosome alternative rescue factor ArfA
MNIPQNFRKPCAVHKDLRTPKYRMKVERNLKGKGSFKRVKKVDF